MWACDIGSSALNERMSDLEQWLPRVSERWDGDVADDLEEASASRASSFLMGGQVGHERWVLGR